MAAGRQKEATLPGHCRRVVSSGSAPICSGANGLLLGQLTAMPGDLAKDAAIRATLRSRRDQLTAVLRRQCKQREASTASSKRKNLCPGGARLQRLPLEDHARRDRELRRPRRATLTGSF